MMQMEIIEPDFMQARRRQHRKWEQEQTHSDKHGKWFEDSIRCD